MKKVDNVNKIDWKKRYEILSMRQKFLKKMTTELLSSVDISKSLHNIAEFMVPQFADLCNIITVDERGEVDQIFVYRGDKRNTDSIKKTIELFKDASVPYGSMHMLKTGKPEFIPNGTQAIESLKKISPQAYKLVVELDPKSYIGVPMIGRTGVIGVITLVSLQKHYTEEDFEFALMIADRIALVLENIRIYTNSQKKFVEHKNRELRLIKESEKKWSFLAEAGKIFSSSLDFKKTLQNVAHLAVPEMADWCMIDLKDENGRLRDPVVVHTDPEKIAYGFHFRTEIAPHLRKEELIMEVIRTGKPQFIPFIDDAFMADLANNKEQLNSMKRMDFTSTIIMPLLVRGNCIGSITFATSGKRPTYQKTDMTMFSELAIRASLAIENAMLYEKAKKAIAMRDDFMSIASHELRTPITSLKMYAQLLKRLSDESSQGGIRNYFERMDSQIDKMSALIDDLLDISRIEHGKFELKMDYFSLDDEVEEVVQMCQSTTDKHTIRIEGKVEKQVHGDKGRISQVIINLINNAIRYSPDSDKIIVRLEQRKGGAFVAVQDFGIGIDEKDLDKLFNPFYRAAGAEKEAKSSPGMGIGLYVASEIIKRHGGRSMLRVLRGKAPHLASFYLIHIKRGELIVFANELLSMLAFRLFVHDRIKYAKIIWGFERQTMFLYC